MLVKNWMSSPPITIGADAFMPTAIKLMQKHEIHMLPVMDCGDLVGIVTELDLKRASGSELVSLKLREEEDVISKTKANKIMTKNPVTVSFDQTIEEVSELFFIHHISSAPVVNEIGKLIGVITKTDIFRSIISLAGFRKDGIQFSMELTDRPGSIKEITDTMRDYGARVSSIISTARRAERGHRRVYIQINDVDLPSRQRLKEVLKEKANVRYIVDHMEKTRELFTKKEAINERI